MGPGDLCGEQRLGSGSAVRSTGGRVQDGPQVLIPGDIPRQSQSPPSHILLVLAHVSSCCLQFLNPFHSCQRFLAAEVAAGLVGQAALEGAPKAPENLEGECFCSPRDGQSLAMLWLLAVSCHHIFHALGVGCVGPQGLWP